MKRTGGFPVQALIPVGVIIIFLLVFMVSQTSRPTGQGSTNDWTARIGREAVQYYREKYGDADVQARVKNYGCHVEIDLLKNGKIVKSLSYYGSGFYELN